MYTLLYNEIDTTFISNFYNSIDKTLSLWCGILFVVFYCIRFSLNNGSKLLNKINITLSNFDNNLNHNLINMNTKLNNLNIKFSKINKVFNPIIKKVPQHKLRSGKLY